MEDWVVHSFDDLLVAVPSDGVNIRWETFQALLSKSQEDKVILYIEDSTGVICERLNGYWHLATMAKEKLKFKATPEAMYMSNGEGEWWPS